MIEHIQDDIVKYMYRVNVVTEQPQVSDRLQQAHATHGGEEEAGARQPIVNHDKVGRNDPCPCGSQKI